MSEQKNSHPFDKMMFGNRLQKTDDEETLSQAELEDDEAIESVSEEGEPSIDFIKIMEHVETLMGSVSELKPLYKKVMPFIDKFKQS